MRARHGKDKRPKQEGQYMPAENGKEDTGHQQQRQNSNCGGDKKMWPRGCNHKGAASQVALEGHIARMRHGRWTYTATVWDPRTGSRSRGRPRQRWSQEFKSVVGAQWTRIARDREVGNKQSSDSTHKNKLKCVNKCKNKQEDPKRSYSVVFAI